MHVSNQHALRCRDLSKIQEGIGEKIPMFLYFFSTFMGAIMGGFGQAQAASIGIIGGADGPTAIFLSSKLAPELLGPIAVAAYSYMALVPLIQPPIMKLLTTQKERKIRMKMAKARDAKKAMPRS